MKTTLVVSQRRWMLIGPTLGQLAYVALVLHDEVDPRRGVHHRPHAADAGELQEGVGDARAAPPRQPVQGLQQQVEAAELQELHHPRLVAALQPAPQPRVVDHGGHLQQPDAQLRVGALQVGLGRGV